LGGVSFQIEAGSIATLIGATAPARHTLRALSGLLRAKSGGSVSRRDITRLPPHQIVARGLAHVPEGRMIFSNLTVGENLAMARTCKPTRPALRSAASMSSGFFPRLQERWSRRPGRCQAASNRCWPSGG